MGNYNAKARKFLLKVLLGNKPTTAEKNAFAAVAGYTPVVLAEDQEFLDKEANDKLVEKARLDKLAKDKLLKDKEAKLDLKDKDLKNDKDKDAKAEEKIDPIFGNVIKVVDLDKTDKVIKEKKTKIEDVDDGNFGRSEKDQKALDLKEKDVKDLKGFALDQKAKEDKDVKEDKGLEKGRIDFGRTPLTDRLFPGKDDKLK